MADSVHSCLESVGKFECLDLYNRTYLEENRDLLEVKREMEEGGYTEYQYDYNGKNLAQLIDECVRSVVGKMNVIHPVLAHIHPKKIGHMRGRACL